MLPLKALFRHVPKPRKIRNFNFSKFRNFQVIHKRYFILSNTELKATPPAMYCMQCEQTTNTVGCIKKGKCGKTASTSNLQDLLLSINSELAYDIVKIGENNLDSSQIENIRKQFTDSTFSTLTNVNFDDNRIIDYIKDSINVKNKVSNEKTEYNDSELVEISHNYGLLNRQLEFNNLDCFGLRETLQYGLKGCIAYLQHSELLNEYNEYKLSNSELRNNIWDKIWYLSSKLSKNYVNKLELNDWVNLLLECGKVNIDILTMLDKSHNLLFGVPEPTKVTNVPVKGKAILLSGHDILDVKNVLDNISSLGLADKINVYTHGELLPAHSYPELKQYKNFIGHFGTAWQNQLYEFRLFPGVIIMTSNCLMPPRGIYRERLYSTNSVGFADIKHIDTNNKEDITNLIKHAVELEGFDDENIKKYLNHTKINENEFLIGFGHETVLSHADTIVSAIKSGDLKDIFVIGGCDGNERNRSYFAEISKLTHPNSVILTAGCGKYRINHIDYGTLGNSGIPRLLDMGQCNDLYSGIHIALKLSEALNTDIHKLPIHFCVSWFEQKAVSTFLSLLYLGIQNIRLGPELPAFLTDNVKTFLYENFKVRQVNLEDEEDDYQQMLNETC